MEPIFTRQRARLAFGTHTVREVCYNLSTRANQKDRRLNYTSRREGMRPEAFSRHLRCD